MTRVHLPSILAAVAAAAGFVMITMAPSALAQGQAFGRAGVRSDGNGNVHGAAGSGFSTDAGGQGLRTRSFNRSSDGSVSAQSQGHATTANGTTFDGSTTYTKGSGFSRSASCRDAAGNAVSCAPR